MFLTDEMVPNRADIYLPSGSAPGPMGTRSRNLPDEPQASRVPCSDQEAGARDVNDAHASGSTSTHVVYFRAEDIRAALGLDPGSPLADCLPNGAKLVVYGGDAATLGTPLLVSNARDEGGKGMVVRVTCRERS